jgi:hypothetical protein
MCTPRLAANSATCTYLVLFVWVAACFRPVIGIREIRRRHQQFPAIALLGDVLDNTMDNNMIVDDSSGLPPGMHLPSTALNIATHAGQRKRKQLSEDTPRVFMLGEARTHSIIGAAMARPAERCAGDTHIRVGLDRFVFLSQQMPVSNNDVQYFGQVFHLKQDAERRARTGAARPGGVLNDHFDGFTQNIWKVVTLGHDDRCRFDVTANIAPRYIFLSRYAATMMNINVHTVQAFDSTIVDRDETQERDLVDTLISTDIVRATSAPAASSGTELDEPTRRLQLLSKPIAGATGHTFSAQGILTFLKFSQNMKQSADMTQCLCDAAALFFGEDSAKRLLTALRDKVAWGEGYV